MALYDTAVPFFGPLPDWLNATDAARLASYTFYKDLLDNDSTAFKITLRDDEENPIYVPTAKRIVRTMARYVCKDLGFTPVGGTPQEQTDAILAFGNLFNREEFFPNFRDALEDGIAQGDFCLYVSGDPGKPEGSRLTLKFIRPGTYFAITDPDSPDRVVGQMMVERIFVNDAGLTGQADSKKEALRRQRWVKVTSPLHPAYQPPPAVPNYETSIQYDCVVMDLKDWEDPTKATIVRTVWPMMEIPGITQLPIYHFRNRGETQEIYGQSELAGFERLVFAINQAVTDEDVALAMQGLGLYVTNQTPVNANGEPTDWILGPRRVVELKGVDGMFERVQGITSVLPSQDHISYLHDQVDSTLGISDVALGQVDTAVAESGIALALRMGPLLDESGRKDDRILSKLKQLFFDLKMWFAVYESTKFSDAITIEPDVGEKLPRDVEKELARLQDLFVNGILPLRLYIVKLNELGMNLGDPAELMAELEAEAQKRLEAEQAAMDASGVNRLGQEANADTAPADGTAA